MGFSWKYPLVSLRKVAFPFVDPLHLLSSPQSPLKPFAVLPPPPACRSPPWNLFLLAWSLQGGVVVGGVFQPHFLLAHLLPGLSFFLGPECLPLVWQTPGLGVCLADHPASAGNRIHSHRLILWKGSSWRVQTPRFPSRPPTPTPCMLRWFVVVVVLLASKNKVLDQDLRTPVWGCPQVGIGPAWHLRAPEKLSCLW